MNFTVSTEVYHSNHMLVYELLIHVSERGGHNSSNMPVYELLIHVSERGGHHSIVTCIYCMVCELLINVSRAHCYYHCISSYFMHASTRRIVHKSKLYQCLVFMHDTIAVVLIHDMYP